MYLGTYVNIQIVRICTDTCTGTITNLFTVLCPNRDRGQNWISDKIRL